MAITTCRECSKALQAVPSVALWEHGSYCYALQGHERGLAAPAGLQDCHAQGLPQRECCCWRAAAGRLAGGSGPRCGAAVACCSLSIFGLAMWQKSDESMWCINACRRCSGGSDVWLWNLPDRSSADGLWNGSRLIPASTGLSRAGQTLSRSAGAHAWQMPGRAGNDGRAGCLAMTSTQAPCRWPPGALSCAHFFSCPMLVSDNSTPLLTAQRLMHGGAGMRTQRAWQVPCSCRTRPAPNGSPPRGQPW